MSKCKDKNNKVLGENQGEYLYDTEIHKNFLSRT